MRIAVDCNVIDYMGKGYSKMTNNADYLLKKTFMDTIVEKYGLFLGVRELCDVLQVSRPLVDQMIATRELPVVKIGKMYRISADEFANWYYSRVVGERKSVQSYLVKQSKLYNTPNHQKRLHQFER